MTADASSVANPGRKLAAIRSRRNCRPGLVPEKEEKR
jgi:hypothetical protein